MKPAKDVLTDRQQEAFDLVRQSIIDRGYPPTLRELAGWMGVRGTRGISDHLLAIQRKGYLRLAGASHGAARGILLTGKTKPGPSMPTHTIEPLPQAARDLAVVLGSSWFDLGRSA